MKIRSALPIAASLSLLATCGGSSSGPQSTMCYGANAVATAAGNYGFSSSFTLTPVTVKSMSNLTIDWGGLTMDFLKHQLSATADVNTVSVLLFQLTLANLEMKLNDDTLLQDDVFIVPPPSVNPTGGVTSAMLHDFTVNGTMITPEMFNSYFDPSMDAFPPTKFTFMVAAATGTTVGEGFRMLQTLQLDPAATNTNVSVTNDSTKLSFSANLHSLTITGVPAATPGLKLDFTDLATPICSPMSGTTCPAGSTMGSCPATGAQSCLTWKKNALGGPFKENYIQRAIVGHYTETPAELEAKFLDLDRIGTQYTGAIDSGSVLDFSVLRDSAGNPFPGVDDTGTWLVGLICGSCRNPAPWYMTILKPCTAM